MGVLWWVNMLLLGVGGVGLSLLSILKRRRDGRLRQCQADRNLLGKVVLITGGSGGLGLETAYQLFKRGASVVLASRCPEKNAKAVRYIRTRFQQFQEEQTSNDALSDAATAITTRKRKDSDNDEKKDEEKTDSSGELYPMSLDLSSLEVVRDFAVEFLSKFERLDILVNNAGVMGVPFTLSPDGLELHFAVNHLGHFYLTNLLLELLKMTPSSRIVIISSGYYRKMKEPVFENLRSLTSDYDSLSLGYARSKLANCLHAVRLSAELASKDKSAPGVPVYAVRPGFVRGTELGRHFSGILHYLATPLIWYFSKNLTQGAEAILHCCLSPEESLESGSLYDNCQFQEYAKDLVSKEAADDLWELSARLVEEIVEKKSPVEEEEMAGGGEGEGSVDANKTAEKEDDEDELKDWDIDYEDSE